MLLLEKTLVPRVAGLRSGRVEIKPQLLKSAQDEARRMRKVVALRHEADVLQPTEQGLEFDPAFQSRERRAYAEVHALTKGQMAAGVLALKIQSMGVRKLRIVAVRSHRSR